MAEQLVKGKEQMQLAAPLRRSKHLLQLVQSQNSKLCIKEQRAKMNFVYSSSVLSRYENQITILSDYLEEFPETDEPVWILGRQHHLNTGICRVLVDPHATAAADFLVYSECLMRAVYFSPSTRNQP